MKRKRKYRGNLWIKGITAFGAIMPPAPFETPTLAYLASISSDLPRFRKYIGRRKFRTPKERVLLKYPKAKSHCFRGEWIIRAERHPEGKLLSNWFRTPNEAWTNAKSKLK